MENSPARESTGGRGYIRTLYRVRLDRFTKGPYSVSELGLLNYRIGPAEREPADLLPAMALY